MNLLGNNMNIINFIKIVKNSVKNQWTTIQVDDIFQNLFVGPL